jgi:hypothetical protein
MTYDYTCQPKQIIDSNVNANDDVASFSITMDDSEMLECFLHHPDPNEMFSLWTMHVYNINSLMISCSNMLAQCIPIDFRFTILVKYNSCVTSPNLTLNCYSFTGPT